MYIKSRFVLLLGLLFLFVSCNQPSVDKAAERKELMELSRKWSEIAAEGDIDSIMQFWAEDAVMLPPGEPMLKGKEAIRSFVESSAQVPGFEISWEPVSAHISDDGSMAYMIERNRIAFNDSLGNRVVQHNKVVTVWRKDEKGSWKNFVDMWNALPPQE